MFECLLFFCFVKLNLSFSPLWFVNLLYVNQLNIELTFFYWFGKKNTLKYPLFLLVSPTNVLITSLCSCESWEMIHIFSEWKNTTRKLKVMWLKTWCPFGDQHHSGILTNFQSNAFITIIWTFKMCTCVIINFLGVFAFMGCLPS